MPIYEVTRTVRVYSDEPLDEQEVIEDAALSHDDETYEVKEI